uniref:RNA polymerase sigma factor 70 region 4 type 2 domain-containing protein n=1 Tax=uncultured prokaryote TaxID=198431 RepID=A0A0H5Q594_9ZZZZ|nr:hypothetical protein [uncultured prokaryote]
MDSKLHQIDVDEAIARARAEGWAADVVAAESIAELDAAIADLDVVDHAPQNPVSRRQRRARQRDDQRVIRRAPADAFERSRVVWVDGRRVPSREAAQLARSLREQLDDVERQVVERYREHGRSWDSIAVDLGVNRETLRRRYGGAS